MSQMQEVDRSQQEQEAQEQEAQEHEAQEQEAQEWDDETCTEQETRNPMSLEFMCNWPEQQFAQEHEETEEEPEAQVPTAERKRRGEMPALEQAKSKPRRGAGGEGAAAAGEPQAWARLDFGNGTSARVCTDTVCVGRAPAAEMLGKSAGAYLTVEYPGISSKHCNITRLASGKVVLVDTSTNGTWINKIVTPVKDTSGAGGRASKTAPLVDGDTVKLYFSLTKGTPPSASFTFVDLRSEAH